MIFPLLQTSSHETAFAYVKPERTLPVPRGAGATSKRSPEFEAVLRERTRAKGPGAPPAGLGGKGNARLLGADGSAADPTYVASVVLAKGAPTADALGFGLTLVARVGDVVTVRGRPNALAALAERPRVVRISLVKNGLLGGVRKPPSSSPRSLASELRTLPAGDEEGSGVEKGNRHRTSAPAPLGATGKGAIVAVIDSGIDWRHADFVRPDGTSRILALYDFFDDSWKDSGGRIGTRPPFKDENGPRGTLYTRAQITAALKGNGTVNSGDEMGHGTAVAGTAAGNGRAAGSQAAAYAGVAPGADLVVVRAGRGESLVGLYGPFCGWIEGVAKDAHEPVVVNVSAGTQFTAHDGKEEQEVQLDALCGAGHKGFAVVVAAGNEREDGLAASGRFSPRLPGRLDFRARPVEIASHPDDPQTAPPFVAYFKHTDDWGLALIGTAEPFVSDDGKPLALHVLNAPNGPRLGFSSEGTLGEERKNRLVSLVQFTRSPSGEDTVVIPLPAGTYQAIAYGAGPKVPDGRFSLALPDGSESYFSRYATARYLVCSPGNAAGVITVGAYNARDRWPLPNGQAAGVNLEVGELAAYSNPGYRRDGVVKPELTAPGSWAISPLSPGSKMAKEGVPALNGRYLAWEGTSAATPYVAGVVALILAKNPTLDAAQIKAILQRTATKDRFTGAVPNADWGYGKINPAAALAATPSPKNRVIATIGYRDFGRDRLVLHEGSC